MGPFALSIPSYRLGVHSHKLQKRRHHDATRQNTESPSPSPYLDSDAETQFSSTSRLPSESINPLSHSPDTLRQLAVAGLSPEDELPSRLHPGFPHKPLPIRSSRRRRTERESRHSSVAPSSDGGGDSGVETDDSTVTSRRSRKLDTIDAKNYSARVRHLNTMAAIMHRCLRDGDIPRAKRAFGLLVRTRDVDVRLDNMWAIGSEILMRDGEQESVPRSKRRSSPSHSLSSSPSSLSSFDGGSQEHPYALSNPDTDEDREEEEREGQDGVKKRIQPPQRWGSATNLAQVKVYLETLIQQHPYDAHRPHLTSAVDFWPALFGIEVYNLDAEFQNSLHQIYTEYGFPSLASRPSSPDREYDEDRMDLDDEGGYGIESGFGGGRRRRHSQLEEEEEEEGEEEPHTRERHYATDALRAETQRGALELAARMDGILENVPYTTHAELLRLRAHVALFIGDLYLPSRLMERYAAACHRGPPPPDIKASLRDAERRLRAHVRAPDEYVALARRGEEQEKALEFFRRVVGARGKLEDWILRLLDAEDEEDYGKGAYLSSW
ncbi:hypothetical protein F5Y10DRAFT_218589 [Nemania abortiva]|nr:hypothetical protein F5Y10DRAFT_218589 [Nemania abortiva]